MPIAQLQQLASLPQRKTPSRNPPKRLATTQLPIAQSSPPQAPRLQHSKGTLQRDISNGLTRGHF
jgi:hypothetical protein